MIEAPQVFTSHWRNPDLRDLDAAIIGISRGTPRGNPGFRYRMLRELAPGDAAWNAEDEESYEAAYLRQLEQLGARRIVEALGRIGGRRMVIMLCWERPGEFCHRRMAADWIHEQTGLVIPELQPGMIPQRQDVPEPRLFDLFREEER